jgi:NTE family protein
MKNLLVLSGGGLKCAYQLGAINYLYENNIKIDCVMGTSGGALNGLLVGQNKIDSLNLLWDKIEKNGLNELFESEYVDLSNLKIKWLKILKTIIPIMPFFTKKQRDKLVLTIENNFKNLNSLATTNKVLEKIKTLVNTYHKNDFEKEFYFNFTDLETGKEVICGLDSFKTKEEFCKGVVASATIPLFLNPLQVKTTDRTYYSCVDGGVSSNVLVSNAVDYVKTRLDREEWRIILVECTSSISPLFKINGLFSILNKIVLSVMLESIAKKDINTVTVVNKLYDEQKGYYNIPFIHIKPNIDLGKTLEITKELHSKRINQGYIDIKNKLN